MSSTTCRSVSAAVLMLGLFTGCATTGKAPAYPAPEPPPEMALLEPLLGEWEGTAEFVTISEEMRAMMAGEDGELPTLRGEQCAEWTLNGMFLKQYGFHEMGTGQQNRYVTYTRWDADVGKFHSWYFSDMGESGESWMSWDPDTQTFYVEATGTRADGGDYEGSGKTVIQDNRTHTWTWSEDGEMGPLEMRGTNTRR